MNFKCLFFGHDWKIQLSKFEKENRIIRTQQVCNRCEKKGDWFFGIDLAKKEILTNEI